jgi:hypothetical protein
MARYQEENRNSKLTLGLPVKKTNPHSRSSNKVVVETLPWITTIEKQGETKQGVTPP